MDISRNQNYISIVNSWYYARFVVIVRPWLLWMFVQQKPMLFIPYTLNKWHIYPYDKYVYSIFFFKSFIYQKIEWNVDAVSIFLECILYILFFTPFCKVWLHIKNRFDHRMRSVCYYVIEFLVSLGAIYHGDSRKVSLSKVILALILLFII